MAEIVNLNKVRKARTRAGKDEQAAANRAKFGRTRAEKARDKAEPLKTERLLDGAKVERPEDGA